MGPHVKVGPATAPAAAAAARCLCCLRFHRWPVRWPPPGAATILSPRCKRRGTWLPCAMRPQIFSAGHDTDPEARQGTEGTLVVKPVKVSACSLLAASLAAAVCAVVLGSQGVLLLPAPAAVLSTRAARAARLCGQQGVRCRAEGRWGSPLSSRRGSAGQAGRLPGLPACAAAQRCLQATPPLLSHCARLRPPRLCRPHRSAATSGWEVR